MRTFLQIGLGLSLFLGCSSTTPISSPADLENRLQKIYKKSLFPGFALTVVKKNAVAYQQTFGVANVGENVAYTNQTTQPIGSVSKLLVGLALMKVVEAGQLTLETDINTVLPFRVVNPHAPTTPILVKHLVTHTSGILDNPATYLRLYSILPGESLTTAEAIRMQTELKATTDGKIRPLSQLVADYLRPGGELYSPDNFGKTPAGSTYAYSNMASSLAAYLVERTTGKSLAEFTKTAIFTPLGMTNTAWLAEGLPMKQQATLYWTKKKTLPRYVHASFPDGMLHTSNEDLGRLLLAMMRAYAGESGVLTKDNFGKLFAKQFSVIPANLNPREDNYGVFWVWFKNGRIGHTGGDIGLSTLFAFYPDRQTGFCFMTNVDMDNGDDSYKLSQSLQEVTTAIKEFEAGP